MKHFLSFFTFLLCTLAVVLGFTAKASAAASFFLSPSSGSYKAGETFSASVMVNTDGQAINAAEGSVSFSSDVLEYQSVSTGGSIFTFWTSGPTGGDTSVSFGGGVSNPGYTGSSGKVLTITWKAKTTGTGSVTINGSKILANDGNGTNIYGSSSGGSFGIGTTSTAKPKATAKSTTSLTVKSHTHPDQDKWYTSKTVTISWSSSVKIKQYRLVFDQVAVTDPSTASSTTATEKSFDSVADGIWYAHVLAEPTEGEKKTTHFRVQIDTKAPDAFIVTVNQSGGATNPAPTVTFDAQDTLSGIDKVEAHIDGGQPFALKSGDTLPKIRPGNHTLVVKAYDKAGNVTESTATYSVTGIAPPTIINWTKLAGIFSPIKFLGRDLPDDTITVYLDNKEIASFLVKDRPSTTATRSWLGVRASLAGEVAWEYVYTELLLPSRHSFQMSKTNAEGAESELTPLLTTEIVSSTIQLAGLTFKTNWLLVALLVLVLFLLTALFILARRMHRMALQYGGPVMTSLAKSLRSLLKQTEKAVDREIDTILPSADLSKERVLLAKKQLKEKIHVDIKDQTTNLDLSDKKA